MLRELQHALNGLKVQEQGLLQQRLALEQRAAAARLLARVMLEAAAHRARMGVADDDAWQRALREQAASLAADWAPPVTAGCGRAHADASAAASIMTSSNGGSSGDGCSGASGALASSDETAALAAAPLEARLAHLAPGRSLLGLEGVTREEVDAVRALTPAEYVERITTFVERARGAAAVLDAAVAAAEASARSAARRAAPPAADVTAARAALTAVGAARVRLDALGLIWAPEVTMSAVTRRLDTGAPASGPDDAPVGIWDGSLRAAGMCREVRRLSSESVRGRKGGHGVRDATLLQEFVVPAAAGE